MQDTRNVLFMLVAGAGFFIAMHQWVTVIAETIRSRGRRDLYKRTRSKRIVFLEALPPKRDLPTAASTRRP